MRRAIGLTVLKLGGSYAFSPHLKDWLDAIAACAGCAVVVPGGGPFADAVRMAQRFLWKELRVVAEPAGATGLAALLSGAYRRAAGERIATLVCGANTDPGSVV